MAGCVLKTTLKQLEYNEMLISEMWISELFGWLAVRNAVSQAGNVPNIAGQDGIN